MFRMTKSEMFIEAQISILKELEPVFSEDEYKRIVRYFNLGVQAGMAAQIINEMDLFSIKKEVKDV